MRALLVLALIALAGTADARRDRTVTGDVIKAARFLTTSRLDEAKTLLDAIRGEAGAGSRPALRGSRIRKTVPLPRALSTSRRP